MKEKKIISEETIQKVSDAIADLRKKGGELSQDALESAKDLYHKLAESLGDTAKNLKEKHDYNRMIKGLDKQNKAINNPHGRTLKSMDEHLGNIDDNLEIAKNQDKKGVLGHVWTGISKPIKLTATGVGLTAVVAVGNVLSDYVNDPDKDIMNIPDDLSAWFQEHPEVGQAIDEHIVVPAQECRENGALLCAEEFANTTVDAIKNFVTEDTEIPLDNQEELAP